MSFFREQIDGIETVIMEKFEVPGQYTITDEGKYIVVKDMCGLSAGHNGKSKAFVKIYKSIAYDVRG